MIKILYVVLYVLAAVPVLGYTRYLYTQEKNPMGAAVVFLLVLITSVALWQGDY